MLGSPSLLKDRTGEYQPLASFIRTSLCSVRIATTEGQYSLVPSSHSVPKKLMMTSPGVASSKERVSTHKNYDSGGVSSSFIVQEEIKELFPNRNQKAYKNPLDYSACETIILITSGRNSYSGMFRNIYIFLNSVY